MSPTTTAMDLLTADPRTLPDLLDRFRDETEPELLAAAAVRAASVAEVAALAEPLLERAAATAVTSRDRQLLSVAHAYLDGDRAGAPCMSG